MNFAMQHWLAVILFLVVGFYVGRKTTLLNNVPYIGS